MRKIIIIVSLVILGAAVLPAINGFSNTSIVTQESPEVERIFFSSDIGDGETEYWAVIVTVFDYEDDKNDVPEHKIWGGRYRIYNATISAKNWKKDHVKFLSNENATKDNITDALMWLQKNVDEDDTVFFYFNGHGSMIPDDNSDEKDGMDEVICPYDTKVNNDGELINIITDDELDDYFDQVNAKGMFLVFNSCLSGGLIDEYNNSEIAGMEKLVYSNKYTEELTVDIDDTNRVILAACKEQQISTGASFFSGWLAYALNPLINSSIDHYVYVLNFGWIINITADKNKDGLITAEEISRFVRRRTTVWMFQIYIRPLVIIQLIRAYKKTGRLIGIVPQIYDGYEGELPIVEL